MITFAHVNSRLLEGYEDYSDRDLLSGLKAGSHRCFETLFYRYCKNIFQVSYKYLNDSSEADGVVQEVFLKVWKYRTSINEGLTFQPYLVRIAKGIIFNKFKRKLTEVAYLNYPRHIKLGSNQTEDSVFYKELQSIFEEGVRNLPERRRMIFSLSRQDGLSNKEIAGKMGISEKTVENQITGALKYLRKFLHSKGIST
ncbi:MAG: RNA polymerase sigma-70 factor [Cytophagales bacterium]|nr:RNA polymerase sigma-70 factor [Cytophagales bacterium]